MREKFAQNKLGKSLLDNLEKGFGFWLCKACYQELKPQEEAFEKKCLTENPNLGNWFERIDDIANEIYKLLESEIDKERLKQLYSDPDLKNLEKESEAEILAKVKTWLESQNLTPEQQLEQIKQYFLDNQIKLISLTSSGDLLIEYQNGTVETIQANSQSLRQIKSYLQSQGKQSISCQELKTQTNQSKPANWTPLIIGGVIGGGLIIGLVVWLILRKKKKANEK